MYGDAENVAIPLQINLIPK